MPQIDEPFRPGGGFDDDAEAAGEFDRNGRFWAMVLRQARAQGRVCLMQAQLQAAEAHLRAALRARRQTLAMLVSVGVMLLVAWAGWIIAAARLMGWLE